MTNPIASPTAPTSNAGSKSTGKTTSAADQQDRFMKLLVAQMKNQDPLNPMDNAQMTSQIAQINTVAGIEKLNATVESLAASFEALQARLTADADAAAATADTAAKPAAGAPASP
ncbi:flagellar hook capping FlgD N-terminal domain-containing protein [Ramlibacter sp.]|uniref:flagellar hook capping FlgD N-terminal domain-containing protein n=1 Tax=Ramlibacter sp. TaxID=1917967 RepID=UPI003D0A703C